MQKFYKPSRFAVIFVIMGVLLAIYLTTLYRLQLFDTGADANAAYLGGDTTTKTVTLTANRGDILDRNGVPLVTSRAAYNVTLSRLTLLEQDNINKIILDLVHSALDNGVAYNDTFPVTAGAPFSYVIDETDTQKKRLEAYEKYQEIDPNISASDLIIWMKEHYGIDYTMNITDARLVIGVRYEMELRAIVSMNPYIFAGDVSIDFITLLEEKRYPGVNIETSAKRVYHTSYAAHVLGYISAMNRDEYDNKYKAMGYAYGAMVGKSGAEAAFESYLHGTDGAEATTTSSDGTVLNVETTKPPTPGSNVFLSIDIGLQAVCEDSLAAKIDLINDDPDRGDKDRVTSGAAVVVDVNTGEILALASYPYYDPSTVSADYADLANNPTKPLWNRATMGTFNPGSTFKMVTALAGLKAGVITPNTQIFDPGQFTKYSDKGSTYSCWIWSSNHVGHGNETVVTALRDSCNVFFYTVGDNAGRSALEKTASDFGLGMPTGIELPEALGALPTEENKIKWTKINEPWYSGNTVLAAIGQDINYYTPVQLARYAATIANGGIKFPLTILDNVRSADFTTVIDQPSHLPQGSVQGSDYITYLQQGMKLVATQGTAKTIFKDYIVPVAAKTGTVQTGKTGGNAKLNDGIFVAYAPADNPQIAISIVVEKGTSGATIMEIAKDIMDQYFKDKPEITVAQDNKILP